MKVSVIGAGYVGLSLAVLLSRKHDVVAVDIISEKVEMINSRKAPIADELIDFYLKSNLLSIKATIDINEIKGSDFVIISTPTNYDVESHYFNTDSVEEAIKKVETVCPSALIVIKSTTPIGFTEKICGVNGYNNVIFSPEFLREGKSLYDNLHPSRIIIGMPSNLKCREKAVLFADILSDCSEESHVKVLLMGSTEAESVKLFSNTYLAMRVAFFNELDTFAESNGLNAHEIINGVCLDQRIGDYYNNPSFGYGGYCLPKDTKQLLANYHEIPHTLIGAIVQSNIDRKEYIADEIKRKVGPHGTIGVYRLVMKFGSDNFRESSVIDIVKKLRGEGYDVIIYEPTIKNNYMGFCVEDDFEKFKTESDLIVANRMSKDLFSISEKVYCRDIFNKD
jgi:UDPglucose 6-dehydrogenase